MSRVDAYEAHACLRRAALRVGEALGDEKRATTPDETTYAMIKLSRALGDIESESATLHTFYDRRMER